MRTITLALPDDLADQLATIRDRLPEVLALSLRQPAIPAQLYRTILTFLADGPTAEQIVAFAAPPEVTERLHTLVEREQAGTISTTEMAELDELERIEHLMIMLKAGALPAPGAAPCVAP